MILWTGLGGVLVLAALTAVMIYNRLMRTRNVVEEAWSGIGVQLKRHPDFLPNLMETVKGSIQQERSVLEQVTELRA